MQHHAPHKRAAFEGYYNKFDLPSGARLVLVISQVKGARTNPNAVSFTYIPHDGSVIYQKEIFVDALEMKRINNTANAFILAIPSIGFVKWDENGSTEYNLHHPDFSLHASTTSLTPWSSKTNTPEGLFIKLPLPLHWHVQSLASPCKFQMTISNHDFPSRDAAGEAIIHQEKNWAHAFPTAHMWMQARDGERCLCAAGGKILGMHAFILGYRSENLNLDIRPPFGMRFLGIGPFMSYTVDWERRSFELCLRTFVRKIVVTMSAPKGSFFSLSPPFAEGHRENFLGQSLNAKMEVKVFERGWFGGWRMIREESFDRAGLEFGAGYYPPAGSADKFN